jgi:hypothetical protein
MTEGVDQYVQPLQGFVARHQSLLRFSGAVGERSSLQMTQECASRLSRISSICAPCQLTVREIRSARALSAAMIVS